MLGMGMPLPVVYILTATLCGPAITTLGIPIIAAHLFLVYFACVSAVTPPVAVAAYAAAAIAEDNPMKIGFAAFRYAIAGFIIPYVMIYDQSILLEGGLVKILIAIASCTLGVIALSSVVSRWLFTTLSFWEQALLFVGGILLIYPESVTSLIRSWLHGPGSVHEPAEKSSAAEGGHDGIDRFVSKNVQEVSKWQKIPCSEGRLKQRLRA
jgi:TRAP-type uncharacterized transport system fused permease subunit